MVLYHRSPGYQSEQASKRFACVHSRVQKEQKAHANEAHGQTSDLGQRKGLRGDMSSHVVEDEACHPVLKTYKVSEVRRLNTVDDIARILVIREIERIDTEAHTMVPQQ